MKYVIHCLSREDVEIIVTKIMNMEDILLKYIDDIDEDQEKQREPFIRAATLRMQYNNLGEIRSLYLPTKAG